MPLRKSLTARLRAMTGGERHGPFDPPRQVPGKTPCDLSGHLKRGKEWKGTKGICWAFEEDLCRSLPTGERLLGELQNSPIAFPDTSGVSPTCQPARKRLVALDIETCGFVSVPLFMVGIVIADFDRLVFLQGLARDYEEEPALLEWTGEHLSSADVLITFNGSTFDLPFLRDRMRFHRMAQTSAPTHLDLLPVCRRTWKGKLPNCRLQTLEEHLLGFVRRDDIPGMEIPDVYHSFVSTGNGRTIARVAKHNRLDLISLIRILLCASQDFGPDQETACS